MVNFSIRNGCSPMTDGKSKPAVRKVSKKPAVRKKTVTKRQPTPKQIKAAQLLSENIRKPKPESLGKVLLDAGYSEEMSKTPSVVMGSETFQALLDKYLPDNSLARTHKRLLETRKLEHMVFPLGPEGEDDINLSGASPNKGNVIEESGVKVERTTLTDKEIKTMLADVNCAVKKIVHGDSARHVYYWTHDANAQKAALELAYKMKGLMIKPEAPNMFNFINGSANFSSGNYKE